MFQTQFHIMSLFTLLKDVHAICSLMNYFYLPMLHFRVIVISWVFCGSLTCS